MIEAGAPGRAPASDRALAAFAELHGGEPAVVVRSPGRVNLVGDHTDYNDGLALPMAIDRDLVVAARSRDDGRLRLWSELDGVVHTHSVGSVDGSTHWPGWTVYVQGVLRQAGVAGVAGGADVVVASDVPGGAGLSSSAALELAFVLVTTTLAGRSHDPLQAARWGRAAENDWVGVSTGIMDQVAIAHARAGHALFLDCASLRVDHVPLPEDVGVVVLDTGARRRLVDSAYDQRRRECEHAARELGVDSLRSLDVDDLPRVADLPADLAARVRHVVTENDRVRVVAAALAASDGVAAGAALATSHASLRDDYGVSGPELDTMAALANASQGVLGARLTGGGFAGAVVALVEPGSVDLPDLLERYRRLHPLDPSALVVRPVDGTGLLAG